METIQHVEHNMGNIALPYEKSVMHYPCAQHVIHGQTQQEDFNKTDEVKPIKEESLNIYENKKIAIEGNSYKIVLQENG